MLVDYANPCPLKIDGVLSNREKKIGTSLTAYAEQCMLSNGFIYTYCELSAAATICIGVVVGLVAFLR